MCTSLLSRPFLSASLVDRPLWAPIVEGTHMRAITTYLDYSDRPDRLSGGARRISVETPVGTFSVWTKRIGNNSDLKMLLLHGGPGATHEYLEAVHSFLPVAGIEYYHYDQLGSGFSDQPDEPSLWELDRFVDEVEQVRRALGLDRKISSCMANRGVASWLWSTPSPTVNTCGDVVISNIMASAPAYTTYAHQVLMPAMDQDVLAEVLALEEKGAIEQLRYMELLNAHYYTEHTIRMPVDEWPEPVQRGFAHINPKIYVPLQGPSEMGMSPDAKLAEWDRFEDLDRLPMPTLVIGARYDTMDPAHMEAMAASLPQGTYLYCPEGSHLAMYDDQDRYFEGLVSWLHALPT